MNTIFKKLSLSDFVLPEDYQVKPLTYSGIQGKADVMGCYIIVFRTTTKPDDTAAISFDDMLKDEFARTVGNDILKRLLQPQIKFGDSKEAVKRAYGEPFITNEIAEDINSLLLFY